MFTEQLMLQTLGWCTFHAWGWPGILKLHAPSTHSVSKFLCRYGSPTEYCLRSFPYNFQHCHATWSTNSYRLSHFGVFCHAIERTSWNGETRPCYFVLCSCWLNDAIQTTVLWIFRTSWGGTHVSRQSTKFQRQRNHCDQLFQSIYIAVILFKKQGNSVSV